MYPKPIRTTVEPLYGRLNTYLKEVMMKLTGKTGYRISWLGKLILQVEFMTYRVKDLNGKWVL